MTEFRQEQSCTKIKYKIETRALLRVDLRGAFYIQKSAFMRRQVLFIYRKEGGQEIEQSKIPNMNPCHWKN